MARNLIEDDYYVSQGGKIPLKWTAPEALIFRKYTTASDVWSYGCVLYEIWSLGHKPFESMTNQEVSKLISLELFYSDMVVVGSGASRVWLSPPSTTRLSPGHLWYHDTLLVSLSSEANDQTQSPLLTDAGTPRPRPDRVQPTLC